MKLLIIVLASTFIIACSGDQVINASEISLLNDINNNNLVTDSINTKIIRLWDKNKNIPGEISCYYTGLLPVIKVNAYGVWSGCFNVTGDMISEGIVSASIYKNNSGTIGKTYTEEFEDKQGNIRTRVYENGLLVSYKINGVEQ